MKKIALILFCITLGSSLYAQKIQLKKALILIDIQDFYFPQGDLPLHEPLEAAMKAASILDRFRRNGELVIHVRHAYEPGGNINKLVQPLENEKVVTKEQVNAFLKTDLLEYLRQNEIKALVLCGMQTHMCLEAATRAGHDFGFECTVIADACTTKDLNFGDKTVAAQDVHASTLATLNRTYAKVISSEEFLSEP